MMLVLKKGQEEMSNMLLQTVIAICISDIDDFKLLPPRSVGRLYSILNRDEINRALIHYNDENNLSIDLFVAIVYNKCIPQKCKELQQLIKNEIEIITGQTVSAVHIHVDAIWVK
ncbi:Asp23/Gls24 family envelope stress response protein [Sutcliffiella horikoshii]|uniref:Asp23/Gls24 family envelope stress response protein n=1 Tax=Sutcliffiella horikoshii TaxID=79883 RepID=A0A5D4TAR8_9BACI|nr:Asp23/Gls24 family envelope stress response protein [Sutcliffiella horikoshii]TYS72717.1 Asp23/Gls24 family envelope stress response protein [Sutcliffiella horikoshii]